MRTVVGAYSLLFALPLIAALAPGSQDGPQRLRERLNDLDPVGTWFYDDIDAATAEAKRSGRPMMVVFR